VTDCGTKQSECFWLGDHRADRRLTKMGKLVAENPSIPPPAKAERPVMAHVERALSRPAQARPNPRDLPAGPQPPSPSHLTTSCRRCPHNSSCKEPCPALEQILSAETRGRGRRECLTGLHPETLAHFQETHHMLVLDGYKACPFIFTAREWEAVCLRHQEGLTQKQIAERLGISRTAVSDRLSRAKQKLLAHQRELRAERRRLEES